MLETPKPQEGTACRSPCSLSPQAGQDRTEVKPGGGGLAQNHTYQPFAQLFPASGRCDSLEGKQTQPVSCSYLLPWGAEASWPGHGYSPRRGMAGKQRLVSAMRTISDPARGAEGIYWAEQGKESLTWHSGRSGRHSSDVVPTSCWERAEGRDALSDKTCWGITTSPGSAQLAPASPAARHALATAPQHPAGPQSVSRARYKSRSHSPTTAMQPPLGWKAAAA